MAGKFNAPRSDYSTIMGIILAVAIVGMAVSMTGNVLSFFDIASGLIVLGGTLSVTLACFTWKELMDMGGSLNRVAFTRVADSKQIAEQSVSLSEYAKKKGLMHLQDKEKEVDSHSLLHKGIRLLADGTPVGEIEQVIRQDIESILHRNRRSSAILRRAAEIAPAMGLIGTLIGLVQMLGELDNPANIGPHMGLALLTTLYGAMLAYMIITPLAAKIDRNSEEELILNKIYLTSIVSIGHLESPRKLERMINTILPPAKRIKIYKE